MQISNYSVPNFHPKAASKPSFGGSAVQELTAIIPNTKVAKNLTQLDRNAFSYYIYARKFPNGITAEDIKSISKFEGSEFMIQAYELLTKKLGLSTDIRPPFSGVPQIKGDALGAYMPTTNMIVVDMQKMQNLKISKGNIFGFIRHELQHFLQNAAVLRHETIGEQAIEKMRTNYINAEKATAINAVKMVPMEQLEQIFANNPEALTLIRMVKDCLEKGTLEDLEPYYEKMGKEYTQNLINLRHKLIDKLGLIKKDSNQTKKIQGYFNEFDKIGYYNSDGQVNLAKYLKSKIEQEAILSQLQAQFEYSQEQCFMHYAKTGFLKSLENPESLKDIERIHEASKKATNGV